MQIVGGSRISLFFVFFSFVGGSRISEAVDWIGKLRPQATRCEVVAQQARLLLNEFTRGVAHGAKRTHGVKHFALQSALHVPM